MNHKHSERLILADRPLTPAEAEELNSHLAGCRACRDLQSGWTRAERALASPTTMAPQPGFVVRWSRLQAAQATGRAGREPWRLLGWTTLAAAILTAVLGLIVWQSLGSVPSLMAGLLEQGLRVWLWARAVGEVVGALTSALPTPVTAGAFIGFIMLLAVAGLTSAFVSFGIIRFSFQGVQK
jgi:predicted anti-sigma-YlaC factor YlaD